MQTSELIQNIRPRTVAIIVAAVCVVTLLGFISLLRPADRLSDERIVVIPTGYGANAIAEELATSGVIRSAPAFSLYAALTGDADSLQAGQYLLCPCKSVPELVRAIASGDAISDDMVVTIPEGMNIWELDEHFASLGLASPGAFLASYGELEGRLFPDTFRIDPDEDFHAVVALMMATFAERAQSYSDEHIIIASMLEKEAKTAEDMAIVSGIIHERLDRGMLLQIDATVGYGWCLRRFGIRATCDVTLAPIRTEIGVDGPYNTYTRAGLPVGPISNPGLRALEAAAHPQASEYLFYLSSRDGSEMVYARTLEEHLQNRSRYLGL